MELTKKTTVLFEPELYHSLSSLAKRRKTSSGDLIREAVRAQYSFTTRQERLAMVDQMAAMNLPVGTPEEIESQLVEAAEPIS